MRSLTSSFTCALKPSDKNFGAATGLTLGFSISFPGAALATVDAGPQCTAFPLWRHGEDCCCRAACARACVIPSALVCDAVVGVRRGCGTKGRRYEAEHTFLPGANGCGRVAFRNSVHAMYPTAPSAAKMSELTSRNTTEMLTSTKRTPRSHWEDRMASMSRSRLMLRRPWPLPSAPLWPATTLAAAGCKAAISDSWNDCIMGDVDSASPGEDVVVKPERRPTE
mmetsp:Transcript_97256/g.208659  ORF Transcript_97256/g.208659 Transcript_97256/m.208659 type:complete len:224 (+) Transcript_97256:1139-1810(+)